MKEFDQLVDIVAQLRHPDDGCPWDIKQTAKSLMANFIEELYETIEAIENGDPTALQEELGDLMLHIVMQAQIAQEAGLFNIADSLTGISNKLVHRHPHVFGDAIEKNAETVKQNWEIIKQKEKKKVRESVIDGVPINMPALIVAWRMQEKAASVGFDWPTSEPIINKIHEETDEFLAAVQNDNQAEMEEEMGDLLFSIVNLARHYRIDGEAALRLTIKKFSAQFRFLETQLKENKEDIYKASLERMDELWNLAKENERK